MSNAVMLQQAHKLIDEIPQNKLGYVIQFLSGAKGLFTDDDKTLYSESAFNNLMTLRGSISGDFDYKKAKTEYLDEKYGCIN
jgi:hypothetical protein